MTASNGINLLNPLSNDAQAQGQTASVGKTTPGGDLGQDQFLSLLVTQLKNQNPLEPLSNTEFITQLATFSSLEKLTSIELILKKSFGGNTGGEGSSSGNSANGTFKSVL